MPFEKWAVNPQLNKLDITTQILEGLNIVYRWSALHILKVWQKQQSYSYSMKPIRSLTWCNFTWHATRYSIEMHVYCSRTPFFGLFRSVYHFSAPPLLGVVNIHTFFWSLLKWLKIVNAYLRFEHTHKATTTSLLFQTYFYHLGSPP